MISTESVEQRSEGSKSIENPSENKSFTRQTWFVFLAILGTHLFERMTFYSISSNLVLFCQSELLISNVTAVQISLAFLGMVYFIPLLGGFLADSHFGRFKTIFVGILLFLVGVLLLTASASNALSHIVKITLFSLALIIIAFGGGLYKANLTPFGGQQIESYGQTAVISFFNWVYWFANLGATLSFLLVAYVQQQISFFIGYLIITVTISLAVVTFFCPNHFYIKEEIGGNSLKSFIQVIFSAFSNYLKKSHLKLPTFLDYARVSNEGNMSDESVDNCKQVLRIIPIFLTLVVFFTVYFQMESTFFLQSEHLNLNLTNYQEKKNLVAPVASLLLFNTFTILLLTPLIDKVLYPLLLKCCNFTPSHLHRMGVGMLFAASGMFVAGILEILRKNDINAGNGWTQTIGGSKFIASKMSVLAQIPQYLLIGIGEIFTSVTASEFAFSESPKQMRGVITGIYLLTLGMGSFFGYVLITIVAAASKGSWLPEKINNGKLENFCFLLGGLILINFIIFIFVGINFNKNKNKNAIINNNDKTNKSDNAEERMELLSAPGENVDDLQLIDKNN